MKNQICNVCEEVTDLETDLEKYVGVNYLCRDCYKEFREEYFYCSECKRFFKIEDVRKEHPMTVDVLEEYEIEDQFLCEECSQEFKKYLYDINKSGVLEACGIEEEEEDYSFDTEDYYY